MDLSTLRFLLEQIPTAALAVVGLYMFATGRIHSDAELRQARNDLATERAAHEQTRAALALANARADAGVRAAELVATAVEGARSVPETTPPTAPPKRRPGKTVAAQSRNRPRRTGKTPRS